MYTAAPMWGNGRLNGLKIKVFAISLLCLRTSIQPSSLVNCANSFNQEYREAEEVFVRCVCGDLYQRLFTDRSNCDEPRWTCLGQQRRKRTSPDRRRVSPTAYSGRLFLRLIDLWERARCFKRVSACLLSPIPRAIRLTHWLS